MRQGSSLEEARAIGKEKAKWGMQQFEKLYAGEDSPKEAVATRQENAEVKDLIE